MPTETYQKKLERHMESYRKARLGLPPGACGTFTYRKVTKPRGHILPPGLKWLNIPEPFRQEVREHVQANSRITLHKYFHHLNSSQALALALFYPYSKNAPTALAKALGSAAIEELEFELVPDKSERTSVDVSWSDGRSRTHCEVKLSEAVFGPAAVDKAPRGYYEHKLANRYAPVLGPYVAEELLTPTRFFKDYQILRNLWLAARSGHEKDQILFLLPKANNGPNEQLERLLPLVRPALRKRIRAIHLEELLDRLAADRTPGGLSWYGEVLREKYVPA